MVKILRPEPSEEPAPLPAEPVPEPAYGLRVHPVLFSVLFTVFAGFIFYQYWQHFPVHLEIFKGYLDRDLRFLFPARADGHYPGFLSILGSSALSLTLLLAFEAVSWRAGACLLRWVFNSPPKGLWGFLLSLGLGNGILGTATLGLGLNGLVAPVVFLSVLVVPLLVSAWKPGRMFLSYGAQVIPPLRIPRPSWLEAVLALFCAAIVVLNLIPALEPEWFYDSLVYHLAVPSRWLLHGRICHLPDTFFSNFPFLQEMQYLFFLGLHNETAARLAHFLAGVLSGVAAFAVASSLFGRTTGLLASAVFFSLPQLRFLSHVTMVELGLTWFGVLATMCFMRATGLASAESGTKSRRAWLFLGAWFLGFGQGTKYLGLFISAILSAWLVLDLLRGRGTLKRLAGDLALITAWGSVWTAPWLAKNFLFTGNPVFPMLGGLLPAINWDRTLYERWMFDNTKYGTGRGSLLNWLMMPVRVSVETAHFGTFTLNPFFLVFLPVLLFLRNLPRPVVFLGLYSAVYAVAWALTSQQSRFLLPLAPQASVAVAFLLVKAWEGRRQLKVLLIAAGSWIFLMSAYGELQNRYSNNAMMPYMMGYIGREDILDMGVQYYRAASAANQVVAPGNRLIFVGGDENYYFRNPVICSSLYDRCAMGELAKRAAGPEDLQRLLRRRRVTHMLVHEPRCDEYAGGGMFEWGDGPRKTFIDFWHTYGRLVYQSKGIFLFDISGPPIPPEARKQGRPICFYPPAVLVQAKGLMARADTLFNLERYQDAAKVTAELVRLVPEVAHAWSYNAYTVGALKKVPEAIRSYSTAIRLGYPTVATYYNLGHMYERTGRKDDAMRTYLAGLELDQDYLPLKERAARFAFNNRKYGVALRLYGEMAASGQASAESIERLNELRAMPIR
jgi:tetratricopeptide (TPR) repeat protein